jgi:Integrase core domain
LSKLAVWWLRLGIRIERIRPGHPQQNGRHERMHLTLKKEATKPPGRNFLQQQARFDDFIEIFNQERPHEALDMNCPAEVYRPATRLYQGLPDIDYPFHLRSHGRPRGVLKSLENLIDFHPLWHIYGTLAWDEPPGVNPRSETVWNDTVPFDWVSVVHALAGDGVWGRDGPLIPFPSSPWRTGNRDRKIQDKQART